MTDPRAFAIENGASIRERNAMFNRCTVVWIARDDDEGARGGQRWRATIDTNEASPGSGFEDARFTTRRDGLELYASRCPNMRVYAQHGDRFIRFQDGASALFPA